MKYETPNMEIMKLDYIFTLDASGESTGSNEGSDNVGGWVPGSK